LQIIHEISSKNEEIKINIDEYTERSSNLYTVLFIVFAELMHENYNGVVRQLMKCFLRTVEWMLRSILGLKENQSVSYLLLIFETFIAKGKVKKDYFDLCKMRNILITDQEAKEMDLKTSLDGTTLCEL